MNPLALEELIRQVLRESPEISGALAAAGSALPATISIARPKNREHGDYATNIAMHLAKAVGKSPREIAIVLAERMALHSEIASAEVAGPGFINFTFSAGSQGELARTILEAGKTYGVGTAFAGVKVNLEFISANPTGPLHLGHTRWAAVGDALGRVLAAAGAAVTREFYVNDRGVQMDRFGASIMAAAHGLAIPEDGYHGAYIQELAIAIVASSPELMSLSESDQVIAFRDAGYQLQLAEQQRVLEAFGTHFDVWFSERGLHTSQAVERAFTQLRKQGHVFELDGATWLKTTDYGDDKDRVLVKADGELTYFASDCAYYVDKRSRGFDTCIYMLGADHHGYIGRLKAIAACAGDHPKKNIEVLIGQMVKIMEGGEEVKLSKRAGTIITLEDIVEMVGIDATRYTLIRYPVDTPMTLDVDVLKSRTNENPVFYVQYAHARIGGILRNAAEYGILTDLGIFDPATLVHERENDLLGLLGEFPRTVQFAAELREPHRIARYLEELAGTYHRFYDVCRVLPLGDEEISAVHRARVVLSSAARQVFENGLTMLGVSAPEHM